MNNPKILFKSDFVNPSIVLLNFT